MAEHRERWTFAEQAYRQALVLYEELARERPTDAGARLREAAAHYNLALTLENKKSLSEASRGFQQAAALWDKLATDFPGKVGYRSDQADSQDKLARVLRALERWPEAEGALRQSVNVRRKLVEAAPDNSTYRTDLAATYYNLAEVLEALDRWDDAVKEYRQAVSLHEQLVREAPKNAAQRWRLAVARNGLGLALRRTAQKAEAEREFRQAAETWAKLAKDFPDKPAYKYEQARTLHNLVEFLRQAKRLPDATRTLRQVEALRQQACKEAPKVAEYAVSLGDAQAALGLIELDQDADTAEVLKWFERALQTLDPHLKDQRFGSLARRAAVDAYRGRGAALGFDGKHLDAIAAYDRLLELCQPEERLWYRGWRARARAQAGDLAKAVEEAGAAEKEETADADDLFLAVRVIALAAGKETDGDTADEYADRALALLRQAVARGFNDVAGLKQFADLKPLRSRKDFQALVKELESRPKKVSFFRLKPTYQGTFMISRAEQGAVADQPRE